MRNHNKTLTRYWERSVALIGSFILIAFTANGHAVVLTSGCSEATSCTLEELFAGGSITVNDKVFENWWLNRNELESDYSQIVVTGLDDGGNDPGPGIRYELNGQFYLFNDENNEKEIEMNFYYDIATTDSSLFIKDSSLTLIDFQDETDGFVGVLENIFEIGEIGDYFEELLVRNIGPLFDSVNFSAQPSLSVKTSLEMYAGGRASMGIEEFEARFSQTIIPVPPALWLFGTGLLGLVGIARRRSKTSLPNKRQQHLSRSHSPLHDLFHRKFNMH